MTSEFRIPVILQAAILLIPMNIYVIGDWMGAGIQWVFFRYITAMERTSIITLNREIDLITSGILTGKGATVSIIWVVGVILLVAATIMIVYGTLEKRPGFIKKGAYTNISAAFVFLISIMYLYGIFFSGPAGIAIPFVVPVLLGISYWQYRVSCTMPDDSDMDDIDEVTNENPEQ